MASNQTEHYGLSQWEATDSFLREEFNEDHRKIDQGLELARVVAGTYTGTESGPQDITLGFRPRAVLVLPNMYNFSGDYCLVGMSLDGADNSYLTITDTGFRVVNNLNQQDRSYETAYPRNPYRYLAWR